MSPPPSDSDGSEPDTNRSGSPRPTTPQEDENLIEEFHSALGEALLDQLEITDEATIESEAEDKRKEEPAAHVGAVNANGMVEQEGGGDVADMQPGGSNPEVELPAGDVVVSGAVDSTAASTRVSAATLIPANVTTLTPPVPVKQKTAQNQLYGGDNHQEGPLNPQETVTLISNHQMSPNALPLEPPMETVPESSSVTGSGEDDRRREHDVSNGEEISLSDSALTDSPEGKVGINEETRIEHEDAVSASRESTVSPEEVANYSMWGESSAEAASFAAEKKNNVVNGGGVVFPPRLPETALAQDLPDQDSLLVPVNAPVNEEDSLLVPVNAPVNEEGHKGSADDDMSPSSRRLPVFASIAAEPSLLPRKHSPESSANEEIPVEQSDSSIASHNIIKPTTRRALPRDGKSGMENVAADRPLVEPSVGFDSRLEPVGTPSSDRHVASLTPAKLPAAPLFTEPQITSPPLSSQDSPGARGLGSAAALVPVHSAYAEDQTSSRGYMVMANPPQIDHRFVPQVQNGQPVSYGAYPVPSFSTSLLPSAPTGGRRKIRLRLQEDVRMKGNRRSWFSRKSLSSPKLGSMEPLGGKLNRGLITVSWFEGTTSAEVQEHVRRSVIRKMGLQSTSQLADLRIIDESISPPEEIVLSSHIPDGSEFLLRFRTKNEEEDEPTAPTVPRHVRRHTTTYEPPVSPSAAPSPYPSSADLEGLSASQLRLLGARLGKMPLTNDDGNASARRRSKREEPIEPLPESVAIDNDAKEEPDSPIAMKPVRERRNSRDAEEVDTSSKASMYSNGEEYPSDPIEARLRQITEILLLDRGRVETGRREEKRQVIFVLANYFVLFLSLIAISAEIQARAPRWMAWLETQMESVQLCATDRDALFECVSNGDFSGLIASFILWVSRSATTKRIFLFGFETPKRLWTVVYEALVTAFCWGMSYTFIRRGMNPDTRRNFLQKYWKDAVYGSLAGFNASFMKAVLKNLIPQEAFENALDDRELRLKIFSWLPSFHA